MQDGEARIPLREVDPVANARIPRCKGASPPPTESKSTGMNAVEDLLRRVARPLDPNDQPKAPGTEEAA